MVHFVATALKLISTDWGCILQENTRRILQQQSQFSFLKAVTTKDRSPDLNLHRRGIRPVGAISLSYFGKRMYP